MNYYIYSSNIIFKFHDPPNMMQRFFLLNYLLLIVVFTSVITSCNVSDRNNQMHLLENEFSKSLALKAENYLITHPDSALIMADSAFKQLSESKYYTIT